MLDIFNRKRKRYLERQKRHNRRRYITKEEKEEIVLLLKAGNTIDYIAKVYNKQPTKIEELLK